MHPNAAWLIEQDDKLEAGDIDGYFAGYVDDVVVHIAGRSSIAGTHEGKHAMMEVFARFNERAGEMAFERHAVLADDLHGVLLATVTMRRDDETFTGTESMIVHFAGLGVVDEVWIDFEDRYAFDAYLA